MSTIPEDYPESLVIVMPSLPCLWFQRITLRAWLLWCHPYHVYDSRGLPWELGNCDAVPTMSMIPEDYPESLVIVMPSLPCLWFLRITLRSWRLWCWPNHVYDFRGLPWGFGNCDAVPTMSMIPDDYPESLFIVMPFLPCLWFLRITLRAWLLWCGPNHVYDSRGLPWGLGYCNAVPTMSTISKDYPEVLGNCDAVPTMSMIPEDYPESLVIVMPSQPCLWFQRITLRSWLLWCRPYHVYDSRGLPWELGYCDAVPTMSTIPEDYPESLVIVMPSLPCLRFPRITLRSWLLWCRPYHVYDSWGLPQGLGYCDAVPTICTSPEDYSEGLVIVIPSQPCVQFLRITLRAWWLWLFEEWSQQLWISLNCQGKLVDMLIFTLLWLSPYLDQKTSHTHNYMIMSNPWQSC